MAAAAAARKTKTPVDLIRDQMKDLYSACCGNPKAAGAPQRAGAESITISPEDMARAASPVGRNTELSAIEVPLLRGPWPSNARVPAKTLWAERTCVVYVVRRMGCPLCRRFAVELISRSKEFEALGVSLAVIASSEIGADMFQVTSFRDGAVYIDDSNSFKLAMGARTYSNAKKLVEPKFYLSTFVNATQLGYSLRDISAGQMLLGGQLIITPRDGIVFEFREKPSFQHAPVRSILECCRAIAERRAPRFEKYPGSSSLASLSGVASPIDGEAAAAAAEDDDLSPPPRRRRSSVEPPANADGRETSVTRDSRSSVGATGVTDDAFMDEAEGGAATAAEEVDIAMAAEEVEGALSREEIAAALSDAMSEALSGDEVLSEGEEEEEAAAGVVLHVPRTWVAGQQIEAILDDGTHLLVDVPSDAQPGGQVSFVVPPRAEAPPSQPLPPGQAALKAPPIRVVATALPTSTATADKPRAGRMVADAAGETLSAAADPGSAAGGSAALVGGAERGKRELSSYDLLAGLVDCLGDDDLAEIQKAKPPKQRNSVGGAKPSASSGTGGGKPSASTGGGKPSASAGGGIE